MRKIVYDVAVTVDGFISHEDGSVDGFSMQGEHAAEYVERLKGYDTVVMGRRTYEWGFPFGLVPGKRAYPHMAHYIFSKTLRFDEGAEVEVVGHDEIAVLKRLKERDGADIYLCGGGAFAGFLLEHDLIDQLVLKVNPIVFGHGIRLFGGSTRKVELALLGATSYASGVSLLRYDVKRGGAA
ncbi:dihydrofolate reductase family protein [Sorangium sp. So ce1000]|uniref:dihydrofolate reductase family protein n=1 Tax=Sorangium sp. So ce1000 TaxID=3133325 RepID=UPI003F5D71F4